MSLVNDMLRDLEQKAGKVSSPAGNGNELLAESSFAKSRKEQHWVPAVLAFVVVGGAVIWGQQQSSALEQTAPEAIAEPVAVNTLSGEMTVSETPVDVSAQALAAPVPIAPDYYSSPLAESQPKVEETQPEVEESQSAAHPSLTHEQKEEIADLLQAATRALAIDRLTSPFEDNAYDRYQGVLTLDPANREASDGLLEITHRYLRLAQGYLDEGNIMRAKVLVRRATAVTPGHADVVQFRTKLDQVSGRAGSSAAKQIVATPQVVSQPLQAVQVVRSEQWLDQDTTRQARELIKAGDFHSARLQLQAFIAAHPNAIESVEALFHLHVNQGDLASAKTLLQQSAHLPATDMARLTAFLFVSRGDHASALKVLEAQPVSFQADTRYLSLMAGIYHKTGRYQASARSYKRLLESHGVQPSYWLGYAVALDALNDVDNALAAFRRAQQGSQSQAVRRYINERIAALSGQSTS